jgi:mannose-6-phosphate isomerase
MELLEGTVRGYAWGSRTAIARLQGRPAPTGAPEAELWLGAHPDSPSVLSGGASRLPLTEVIAADAVGLLGEATVDRYGARLPFLLKVLAAAEPLSLQVHPDSAQAAQGYAAEEAAGLPQGAPQRNYRDAHHKPELLVAIDEFDALCGFRDPAESAELLAALDVPGLRSTVDKLRQADPALALQDAFMGLTALGETDRLALVGAVVAAAGGQVGAAGGLAVELADRYPGDIGVLLALLLNQVRLAPGEAVWMPAGNLHAYLRGTGIEIMAASDNVLRAGLTPKHVDVPELLRLLRFEVLKDPVVRPQPVAPGLVTWPTPIDDFALHRTELTSGGPALVRLPGDGPRIVLCLRGCIRVDDGVAPVTIGGGQAAFGRAGRSTAVSGDGVAFDASTGAPRRP